jgi:hypothetical protein
MSDTKFLVFIPVHVTMGEAIQLEALKQENPEYVSKLALFGLRRATIWRPLLPCVSAERPLLRAG